MGRPRLDDDLATVKALAKDLGLGPVEPIILKLAHHTTIRLSPHPIVARVQSSEPAERAAAMAREVALARHLAEMGAPTVAATIDPPPGPYVLGRAATSLWAYVEHRPPRDETELTAAAQALRLVHAALRGFGEELPPFTRVLDRCGKLLSAPSVMPTIAPDDRTFLQSRLGALREQLGSFCFEFVPLHGGAHVGNVLIAARGAIWADLEAVCVGPLEWDLASLPPGARAVFADVDPALLDHLAELRSVTVATWCWADASRSEEMRSAAEYHLQRLRRRAQAPAEEH